MAMMEHPMSPISSGVTPMGRPFFVMELVRASESRTIASSQADGQAANRLFFSFVGQ